MSPDTTSFRMGTCQELPSVIRKLGFDPEPLLEAVGLNERLFRNADNRIEAAVIGRLLHLAARSTGRQDIGLLVAEDFKVEQLGILGMIMAEGPDVRTALRNLCRMLHYNNRAAVLSLIIDDKDATLKYDLRNAGFEGAGIILDSVVAMMLRTMRRLCGPDWLPLEVHLSRRKPEDAQRYAAYFRAPLRFNSVQDAIVLRGADLDRPVPGGRAAKQSHVEAPGQPVEVGVRQWLASMIGLEEISLTGVAAKLGMSRRTLIRHLMREQTSFQSILDDVRSTRARHLLSRGDAPIAEIAFALGFGDAGVFTRSFRRWTGSSPSDWRRQNRSA